MLFEATIYNILWQAADASTDNKSSLQKRIYKLYVCEPERLSTVHQFWFQGSFASRTRFKL